MGFGILGVGVQALRFGLDVSGFICRVWGREGLGLGLWGFRVLGFRVKGVGFRAHGVWGFGFRVWGWCLSFGGYGWKAEKLSFFRHLRLIEPLSFSTKFPESPTSLK